MLRPRLLVTAVLVELAIVAACGARTGLPLPREDEGDGGAAVDAGVDRDAPPDVPPDLPPDVPDVIEEGLPPCDPDALYVYLITQETVLYRFDPANNVFLPKGALICQTPGSPFSMGVNRKGQAFVVYNTGELFLVDVEDVSCQSTDFEVGQEGFNTFGMGFAIDDDMMGESLYVAEISFEFPSLGLARIDTNTLDLQFINQFSQLFGNSMELTSSDDGKLYGYNLDEISGGWVLQIDKETAEILETTFLPVGDGSNSALAFAYWGGDFYVFTSPGGGTTVTRYRPSDGSVVQIATLNETVVGAGVSTCNPNR